MISICCCCCPTGQVRIYLQIQFSVTGCHTREITDYLSPDKKRILRKNVLKPAVYYFGAGFYSSPIGDNPNKETREVFAKIQKVLDNFRITRTFSNPKVANKFALELHLQVAHQLDDIMPKRGPSKEYGLFVFRKSMNWYRTLQYNPAGRSGSPSKNIPSYTMQEIKVFDKESASSDFYVEVGTRLAKVSNIYYNWSFWSRPRSHIYIYDIYRTKYIPGNHDKIIKKYKEDESAKI